MTRRKFLDCGVRFGVATGLASPYLALQKTLAAKAVEAQKAAKPNIIWILLDACRASHLSCYGYERDTSPNIDALAKKGVVFESNFSQMYATSYSVPSYMTGRYFPTPSIGFMDWQSMWRTPPAQEVLFPTILNEAGYYTGIITCLPWFPGSRMWKEFDEGVYVKMTRKEMGYAEFEEINERAFNWISKRDNQPFFLYLHVLDTHFPHKPVPPYDKLEWIPEGIDKYTPPYSPLEQEYLRGIYDASILYADQQVGRLVDFLDSQGLMDNTILVVGADHGDLLGEDGQTISHPAESPDELYHVPLIMAGPGLPKAKRISGFSENVDIVPTLLDLANIEDRGRREGRSLLEIIGHKGGVSSRSNVVSAIRRGNDVHFILRDRQYKYEWNPKKNIEYLWKLPDNWGKRTECLKEYPEIALRMRKEVEKRLIPLWEEYLALPQTSPAPFSLNFNDNNAEPADAWTTRSDATTTDNKWVVSAGFIKSEHTENPPPISFNFEVPKGPYEVQIRLNSGTSMAVKINEDTEFKLVRLDQGRNVFDYVPIGKYNMDSGSLSITIKKGNPEKLAWARGIRLIPLWASNSSKPSAEDLEQLETLGYL